LPIGGARRDSDAEALGVEGGADLHDVTVTDGLVLVDRRVPEKGIVLTVTKIKQHQINLTQLCYLLKALRGVLHHGVGLHLGHLGPHLGEVLDVRVLEEGHDATVLDRPVLNLRLLGQICHRLGGGGGICTPKHYGFYLDGRVDFLDGEEGGQVGCVRGDEDEGEEPPGAGQYTTWDGAWRGVRIAWGSSESQGAEDEPEGLPHRNFYVIPGHRRLFAADPLQGVEHHGHDDEGAERTDPHYRGERVQELKVGRFAARDAHQDRDVARLERLGEVHGLLSLGVDGQGRHRHCGVLVTELAYHAVPLPRGHLAPELAVVDQVDLVVEFQHPGNLVDEVDGEPLELVVAAAQHVVPLLHRERALL
ncbi:hypothetical protein EGW08_018010, partial [Elysia chlorotica]